MASAGSIVPYLTVGEWVARGKAARYLGKSATFDGAIVEFSHAYAEQNERDYHELVAAVESGRITAETGL